MTVTTNTPAPPSVPVRTDSAVWATMPGWGIAVDLIPPEVINARRLKVLRRLLAVGMLIVVALCAAGYVYAVGKKNAAQSRADDAMATQLDLSRQQNNYVDVTEVQSAVAGYKSQLQTAMTTDVDTSAILAKIFGALPNTMTVDSVTFTVTAVPGNTAPPVLAGGLSVSPHPVIGSFVLTGKAQELNGPAQYVDTLSHIKGVINIVPVSNERASGVVSYTINAAVTDELFSHHYDVNAGGPR